MLIYVLIAILFFLFKNINNKYIQIICVGILFLMGAFRAYTVGTDTYNTFLVYESGIGMFAKKGEYGLELLTNYIIDHNYSMRWELIITQMLFIGSLFFFCYKKAQKPLLMMLLFILCGYVYMSYNITRQMLALSIVIWAYYNRYEKGSPVPFVLVILLATLIHSSAIVVFLIFFIDKYRYPKMATIIILIVTFIIPQVFSMNFIAEFVTSRISLWNRYSYYLESEERGTFSINRLFMNLFFIYLIIQHYIKVNNDLFFKSMVFGLVILNLFPAYPVITRIGLYFTAVQPVFFYHFIQYGKVEDKAMVAFYTIAIYATFLLSNNGGIVPYDIGGF